MRHVMLWTVQLEWGANSMRTLLLLCTQGTFLPHLCRSRLPMGRTLLFADDFVWMLPCFCRVIHTRHFLWLKIRAMQADMVKQATLRRETSSPAQPSSARGMPALNLEPRHHY
ncbi:hypothetical protein V8C44DRAFT_322949 [Trichoderma aethiopicum]